MSRSKGASQQAKKGAQIAWGGTKSAITKGSRTVSTAWDKGEKAVTQRDAFEAYDALLEEMAMIVAIQHARIVDLESRVTAVESQRGIG